MTMLIWTCSEKTYLHKSFVCKNVYSRQVEDSGPDLVPAVSVIILNGGSAIRQFLIVSECTITFNYLKVRQAPVCKHTVVI